MAKKKNNNLGYIFGSVVIFVMILLSLNFISARSCTYSYECSNGGDPWAVTSTTAKYQKCENGVCVEKTMNIECKQDSDCRDKYGGGVCDLALVNFGNCVNIPSAECGDGTCQPSETKSGCPQDCDIDWKIRQINNQNSSTNTLLIIGAIIIGFIALAIILKKKK